LEFHFWIEKINNGYVMEYKLKNRYESVYCKDEFELEERFKELIELKLKLIREELTEEKPI